MYVYLTCKILHVRQKNTRDRDEKWRSIVNSFRFAIRQSHSARSSSLERTADGASTMNTSGYISWMQIAVTKCAVCEESKRRPDFPCMTERCPVDSPLAQRNEKRRRPRENGCDGFGKGREINADEKEARGKGGNMQRYAGRIFTIVALRTESHLKSTQFSAIARIREATYSPSVSCASLPPWTRGCLRGCVLRQRFRAFDGRYIGRYTIFARDLHDSLIYEHRGASPLRRSRTSFSAHMSYGDFLRGSPSPATEIDTSMISIADVAGDAMQCRPKSIRFHLSRYCASDLNAATTIRIGVFDRSV